MLRQIAALRTLSQSQFRGGVVPEQRPAADILAERSERTVPGLAHDVEFPGPVQVGLGAEAGAQAMPGIGFGIEARPARGPFDDAADRILVQGALADAVVPVDAPEQRPVF